MPRSVLYVLLIIVFGGAGYFVYDRYSERQLSESFRPAIKNASLRVFNALDLEAEGKITYKELFERIDEDVKEIEKKVLDIQAVATARNMAISRPVIEYLKRCQETLRAQSMMHRKVLAVDGSLEWSRRAVNIM